jgi:predicted MFS family arabinose efflux permease
MISYYLDLISIDLTLLGITLSMFLAGFFIMNFNIPMSLVIQRNVEPRQLGKVSSVMNVLSQALIPIGSMLAGVIISQLSIIYFFVFVTIGAWIVVLIYINNKVSNEI